MNQTERNLCRSVKKLKLNAGPAFNRCRAVSIYFATIYCWAISWASDGINVLFL